MGGFFSKIFGGGRQEQWRVLLLGLDAAGKTTTLYALKHNEAKEKQKGKKKKKESKEDDDDEVDAIPTVPTIGFNVETVEYKDLKFNVWDVGGQDRLRPLWRQYYSGTHGIMFIIDSNDTAPERIQRAKEELHGLMNEIELRNAKLAVVLNKRDLAEGTTIGRADGTQADNTIEFWKQELQLEAIQTKREADIQARKQRSQSNNNNNKSNKNNNSNNTNNEPKRHYATFPAIAKQLSNEGIFHALDWLHENMEPL